VEEVKKKKKSIFKKWWFWVIVIIIIGKVASSGGKGSTTNTSSTNDTKQATKTTETKKEEAKQYKVGDVVAAGDFQYKVLNVSDAKQVGNEYANKKTDNNYIIVSVEVKNTGKEAKTFDSSLFKLKTNDGTTFNSDGGAGIYANTDNKTFLEQVNPGITVKGNIVFETPKKSTENTYTLEASGGFLSGKTVDVVLK
jgi:hypothetical protein